mmetsp:Transcript_35660/g.100248  ORF Transcript_35660/g.100248 Transcript_35660/m.100248 type:complete len:205 (+) Transcript_35660:285-899(+)
MLPGRSQCMQDEKDHAARKHVDGSHGVAVDLGHGDLPRHCIQGEAHVQQVAAPGYLHRLAGGGPLRALGLDGQRRVRGHVHLRCPVVVLAAHAEVAQLHAVGPAELDGLPEVHQLELVAPQEEVLERDVSMADVVGVDVPDRLEQLRHEAHEDMLVERAALVLVAELLYVAEQVAVAVLQHEPRGGRVEEGAQRLQEEGALVGL